MEPVEKWKTSSIVGGSEHGIASVTEMLDSSSKN
jgi:hypothetical protein